jgi:hypothetical protein
MARLEPWTCRPTRVHQPPAPLRRGFLLSRPKGHRGDVSTLQIFDLHHAVRSLAFDEPRGLHRVVLAVAVCARRAVYSNFESERPSLRYPVEGAV